MKDKLETVDGVALSCSMGSCSCCLKVPASRSTDEEGKRQATVMDYKPGVNITSFGTCTRMTPPQPCVPVVLIPWMLKDKKVKISGDIALSDQCVLSCLCGGVIGVDII
ncbi:DUF4280 domain-containing protein [Lacrimispora sp.]|jgi:hypothetical protein|uniref:DUF4280 domain-containing protein n=1 Tax=Lacrimispora sp. TaxID=2719234 RepID=UPI0028AD1DFF|nr:DUF4280 domain-containing protein [Lacrimispora sp.]